VTPKPWPLPTAGDIVWCHFPIGLQPAPKPRPALVLAVYGDAPPFGVTVVYGTSQRTTRLYSGEFGIYEMTNPAAYRAASLSFDTKFDLKQRVDLPFTDEWFSVPPRAPFGQVPKIGVLHASMMRALQAAYAAATSR